MPAKDSARSARVREISELVGERKLVWYGTRGEDGTPLLCLPQFLESYACIGPAGAGSVEPNVALEQETLRRRNLDYYTISTDSASQVEDFRRELLASLRTACVLIPYSSDDFVSALQFVVDTEVVYAGLFSGIRSMLEHKPWVESRLRALGIPTIPWCYVASLPQLRALRAADRCAVVVRASRTAGGLGLTHLGPEERDPMEWSPGADALISVSPYWKDAIPVNVGACVFATGEVRLHTPSIQLIGIDGCTDRVFGYCGNDFGAVRELSAEVLDRIEEISIRVGRWLLGFGYLGAFGVDLLAVGEEAYLTEINPRFQGSSSASAEVARAADAGDLYLDHIAAFLGGSPGEQISLREWAARQPDLSLVVCHNLNREDVRRQDCLTSSSIAAPYCELLSAPDIAVEYGAILCRFSVNRRVTDRGADLDAGCRRDVETIRRGFRCANGGSA